MTNVTSITSHLVTPASILSKVFNHEEDIQFCLDHATDFAKGEYDPALDGLWSDIRTGDVCGDCFDAYVVKHDLCFGCAAVLGAMEHLLEASMKDGAVEKLDLPQAATYFVKLVNVLLTQREVAA